MKKIAFVLACILTISICLAGCQETEFDTGEGTPVFSLDANEISAVTFQNGNTGEKTIVSNRDEITEIADYLNAFRYTETQSVRGGDGWSSRIIIDFNEGESISFYSLEAGKIIMDDTASSRRGGWSSVEFTPTSSNGNYICFQHKNKTDQNVRVYLYRTDESSRNYVTMMCVDANDVNSEVYYSPTAGFGTYKVVIEAYVSGGEISGDVVVNQCKNAPADPLE